MSLFRQASAWALRALAIWAAIELGASAYDRAADAATALAQISGHRTAMSRLEERARIADGAAAALEARITAATPSFVMTSASPEAAAAGLRQSLIELGAQAPVVEAGPDVRSGNRSGPLTLTASWREQRTGAPQAFYGLAQRYPRLGVTSLALEAHDELIHAEAEFSATITPPAEARR